MEGRMEGKKGRKREREGGRGKLYVAIKVLLKSKKIKD